MVRNMYQSEETKNKYGVPRLPVFCSDSFWVTRYISGLPVQRAESLIHLAVHPFVQLPVQGHVFWVGLKGCIILHHPVDCRLKGRMDPQSHGTHNCRSQPRRFMGFAPHKRQVENVRGDLTDRVTLGTSARNSYSFR